MAVRIGNTPSGFPVAPLSTSASQVKRAQIDAKHPDWLLYSEAWFNTCIMYEGEPIIGRNIERFLKRRPKEDSALFQHRMDLFTYENHLGTGLGYYEAAMFDQDPEINIVPKRDDGTPDPDAKLSPEQDQFYNQYFLKNCDRAGTPFVDKFQKVFQYLLLYKTAWILDDMPKADDPATVISLKDQQDQHLLDPYKILYSPLDVINWEVDANGNLVWVVIFTQATKQGFLQKPQRVDRWYYYDKQQYRVYEQSYEQTTQNIQQIEAAQDNTPVYMVETGYHTMAKYNQVPLQHIEVPNGWWLARRAYSPARKHINISNILDWSLAMAALAVPIIKTEMDVSQLTISEAGFIKLGQADDFGYAEPEGTAWDALDKREQTLKEAIFRSMYLIAMSRSTNATASAQSGVSKQQDMAPSQIVLSGLGAVLRTAMQEALNRTMQVRAANKLGSGDENLTADVRGFDFEDKLSVEEIDAIQTALDMGVPSDTFEKEAYRMAVRNFLKNANPDLLNQVFEEIAKAPNKAERDMQQQQQQMDMRQQALRKSIAGRLSDPVAAEATA